MSLSKSEIERYQRQLIVDGWDQGRLVRARVLVVGAGGLGGISSMYLAAAGVGRLRICDSDMVELSNLNRQIVYGAGDVGKPKAALIAERLSAQNPEIKIEAVSDKLTDANAAKLAAGCDVIVDGLDNHADRLILNKASLALRIPFVYGAINEWLGQTSLFEAPKTACLACLMPEAGGAPGSGGTGASGATAGPGAAIAPGSAAASPPGPTPVFGAMPGTIGALQATLALRFLLTGENPVANTLLFFRADTMVFERVSFEKRIDCPVCGKAAK